VSIGFLVSQYPAPSHTFIRREVGALRGLGLDVETFSVRPGECLSDEDRAEERRTFYILPAPWISLLRVQILAAIRHPWRWATTLVATVRLRLPGLGNLLRSFAYFAEAMRLVEELERRGVVHLHNHFANASSHVGLAACRYLGIGWSVTLHGLADFGTAYTSLLPRKIAAARFVAAATRHGCAEAARLAAPGDRDKVRLVRCGIEVPRLPAPARRAPGPGEPLLILTVGRLAPEKGQVGLVEAFSLLVERGVDARLVIIGGGPDEGTIRDAVLSQGLANRVSLAGQQPETAVLDAMSRAHLFVLSSLAEGLPVVLMEALALELPVVAPAIAGIPELVVDGETGLLFRAGNWVELADRISTLAADPVLRGRLAAAGRARVLAEFDVSRAVVPLAALLTRAVEAGGGSA
jgi:colanic acid/amylovoran biosynthesis glycosyltransferase